MELGIHQEIYTLQFYSNQALQQKECLLLDLHHYNKDNINICNFNMKIIIPNKDRGFFAGKYLRKLTI